MCSFAKVIATSLLGGNDKRGDKFEIIFFFRIFIEMKLVSYPALFIESLFRDNFVTGIE